MPSASLYPRIVAAAIAACFPAIALAADVARVDFAVGNVTAVGADGRSRPLASGSQIEVGDTVNTQQGRAQLRFEDGAYMSLQPETAFKVEQFRFTEKGRGDDSIVMHLLKGGMRTITGLIGRANKQNYRFRTEVATIGIRGTEFSVRYTNSIDVFCAGGSIEIENEGGTLVLSSGQGASVQSFQAQPQRTSARPFLPPSAAGGSPAEQAQASSGPANPLQDANPVTAETLLELPPALAALPLTGTFSGEWSISQAAILPSGGTAQSIAMDPAGALISFDAGGTNLAGTAQAQSSGNDGIIAWGRWMDGQTAGTGTFSGKILGPNDPLHYVVGLPVTAMPAGTAVYSMLGATVPSCGAGCSATVDSSSLNVDFGQSSLGLSLSLTVNGPITKNTYSGSNIPFTVSGGKFAPLTTPILSGGPGGTLTAAGFFSGEGAARAGMVYHLDTTNEAVNGAIAYQRTR